MRCARSQVARQTNETVTASVGFDDSSLSVTKWLGCNVSTLHNPCNDASVRRSRPRHVVVDAWPAWKSVPVESLLSNPPSLLNAFESVLNALRPPYSSTRVLGQTGRSQ